MDNEQRYKENEKLVYYVLKKSFPAMLTDEDIVQEAKIGLWKACISFRQEKGCQFSSYAYKVIYNSVLSALNKRSHYFEECSEAAMLSIHQPINPETPELTYEDTLLGQEDFEYRKSEQRDFIYQILTKKEYSIFNMIMKGMKQCEVAKVFGVSSQCMNAKIMRIRKKLEEKGIRN